MSEQGWQDFLAPEGVDDWVALHGGATAVFRVRSLGEAARLAEAVANVPGLEGSGVLAHDGRSQPHRPAKSRSAGLSIRLARRQRR